MGYHRAGFDVVGVDINPQPNYPFEFIQADALDLLSTAIRTSMVCGVWRLTDFDAIHASPPCQFYSNLKRQQTHWRSIPPTREKLQAAGLPYVIENIGDAAWELDHPIRLCGSMFGLKVRRHRLFETTFPVMTQTCWHGATDEIRAYYGKKGWLVWTPAAANVQKRGRKPLLRGSVEQAPEDMGIDWMQTWDELREAIPPAYTEHIGGYLLAAVLSDDPAARATSGRRGS